MPRNEPAKAPPANILDALDMDEAGDIAIDFTRPLPRQGFAEECRRQAQIVATADAADDELSAFLDAGLVDREADGSL